jgi:hypothetical protein
MAENVESAVDTGKGLARMIGAGFKSPMDFSLNVAKGFHNVPKLYGAEVRQVDKVTDFNSGMRTAAKVRSIMISYQHSILTIMQEFGYGLYDGITGIVTDPYKGAKKEGGIGFVKGVGRGIMSVPFRVMGGAWSVPGYAMKGLYQEMVKSKGKSVQNYIIAARIAQGYEEASTVSQQERDAIVRTWHQMKGGIKKKGNPATEKMDSLHSLVQQKRDRKNERSAKLNAGTGTPGAQTSAPSNPAHSVIQAGQYPDPPRRRGVEPEIRSTIPSWRQQEAERTRALQRQTTTSSGTPSTAPPQQSQAELEASLRAEEEEDQRELERAIAASVADSSRGDPEEDRLLASAIRASIAELEAAPAGTTTSQDEEEALRRAMNASMEEAGKTNISEEEQKALEETLRNSLLETKGRRRHGSDSEWNSDADTEEDEEYQRIIAESKQLAHLHEKHPNDFENSKQGAQQESGMMEAMSQAIGAADDEPSSSRNVGVTDEKSSYSQLGQQAPPSHQQGASTTNPPSYQQPAPAAPPSNQQASPPAPPPPSYTQSRAQPSEEEDDEDAQLKKVLAESEQAEKEREKQRTEEDIVMEYVRKQSLLEEEHRQRALQERDSKGGPAAT